MNGLTRWLVGLLTTLLLAWVTWASTSIMGHDVAHGKNQSFQEWTAERLESIDDKLDRLLRRDYGRK